LRVVLTLLRGKTIAHSRPFGAVGGADQPSGKEETMCRVEVDIFSARPNPVWIITDVDKVNEHV
jgi:hypothetical protein